MRKDIEIKRKIKDLMPKYDQKNYIIGNVDKNRYVQFVPALTGYHLNKEGRVCKFSITDVDCRKKIICPTCKADLMNELKGV